MHTYAIIIKEFCALYTYGVLIYDISETGTLKDATSSMRFRNVYLAVPKKF